MGTRASQVPELRSTSSAVQPSSAATSGPSRARAGGLPLLTSVILHGDTLLASFPACAPRPRCNRRPTPSPGGLYPGWAGAQQAPGSWTTNWRSPQVLATALQPPRLPCTLAAAPPLAGMCFHSTLLRLSMPQTASRGNGTHTPPYYACTGRAWARCHRSPAPNPSTYRRTAAAAVAVLPSVAQGRLHT